MFDNIGDIKTAISRFRTDTDWTALKTRWQTDLDLFRLKPYNPGKGYYSYVSDYPRVLANKIINMLCESELYIRVPEELLTDDLTKIANNVERFLYGSFNLNDEKLLLLPDMPTLRAQLAWYSSIRGTTVTRVYVHKDEDGNTFPDVKSWDIYNVAYGKGKDGLQWAAHTYKVPAKQAEYDYGIKSGFNSVDIIDYWDTEKYCVIVAEEWGQEFVEHKCGRCPVFILRAGATPPIWQNNLQHTGRLMGESIYDSIREIMPILNKTIADYVMLVRRGVKVPLGVWSPGGTETIEEDVWGVEKAAVVPLDTQTIIKPLFEQTMPADAAPLLNWISGELQRGGLPHTAFGELGFRLSGFAINQLMTSLQTVIAPYVELLERTYTVDSLELIRQYTKGGFAPVKVRGRTSQGEAFGFTEAQKIKPTDLKGDWHPEIKLTPVLPKDDAQRYQLARFAREGEVPLLADETIRSEILGVKDTDLEAMKIDREWAEIKLVVNRLYRAYQAATEEGRPDIAQNILRELRRYLASTEPTGGQGQGGGRGMTATEQTAMGTEGVGMPPGKTGMSSETLPPETQGGMPPGALNAVIPTFAEEM